MNQQIKFSGYLTFKDSMEVMEQIENKKFFTTSGIVTIMLLVAFAITIALMSDGIGIFIFSLTFLCVVMSVGAWFIRKSNRNEQKKHYEKECVSREGTLAPDKITIKFDKIKTEINWELFDKAIKIGNAVVIVKDNEFLGFAEYMFNSHSDWLGAKELISKKYVKQAGCR